ncbi:putative YkgJ family cysteine cluster protein [Vibrio chagasii]|nr:putative YkgJ family cysteine cluster protein [Vibrio chagasii]
MRNVDPNLDIPLEELTKSAQEKRIEIFRTKPRTLLTQSKGHKLEELITSGAIDGLSDKQILAELNEVADQILSDEISPVAVCRKGCGHCCRFPVHVTSVEAKVIANYADIKLNKLKRAAIIESGKIQDDYCPFFDKSESQCSVYEVRPLTCKLHASLDHYDYCAGTDAHTHTSLQVTTPVNHGYGFLIQRLMVREKSGKGAYAADIRSWFASAGS